MKILVISDIHAMSKDLLDLTESTQPKPSGEAKGGYSGSTRGNVLVEERSTRKNRLLAIPNFLTEGDLSGEIDCLICLGDLAHQCKKGVLQIIWQQLNDIAADLKIPKILAVSGNHDVAAHEVDFENGLPNDILKKLSPPFPIQDPQKKSDYHADKFTLVEEGNIGIILIDTSSLLGYSGANKKDLWSKGFISDDTIVAIESRIKASSCTAFVIAMHHHPAKVHRQNDIETDYIENGANFLKMLEDSGKHCFVLHGHKHFVSFRKYSNTTNAPWILSASSLAAKAYPNMEEHYKCQFHILDVNLNSSPTSLFGQISSWDWVVHQWEKASSSGMTHLIGFGRQATIPDIANSVFSEVSIGGTLSGKTAFEKVPELKLLTQEDIDQLQQQLSKNHSVKMIADKGVEAFSFFVEES